MWFLGIFYLLNSFYIMIRVKFFVIIDIYKVIGVFDCLILRKFRSLVFLLEVILRYSFNGNFFINIFLSLLIYI